MVIFVYYYKFFTSVSITKTEPFQNDSERPWALITACYAKAAGS